MNKFKYYFILLITTVSFFSCSKNNTTTAPPRDYTAQNNTDSVDIEEYLKNNFITVINHPGMPDDQDVTFTKITDPTTQPSIMSYLNASTYPKLLVRTVAENYLPIHNVPYKIYYLVLRPGVGQSPCNVDGVLVAYHGEYLERISTTTNGVTTTPLSSTPFEDVKYPQSFLSLYSTITGWSEIFPQFKSGTYSSNPDGTTSYTNFGAGVMFIPSGLAYYNTGSGIIPAYAPLVFSFKLLEIQRLDQDGDGIPSYLEDINRDGYVYDYRNTVNYSTSAIVNPDDTDGDTIPDFLDVDDDNDNYTTKLEVTDPSTNLPYPFAQIPTCTLGKKNYLDATCHP